MEQNNQQEEIEGEDGWELTAAEEAALSEAWERERTPQFLERIKRQELEYDKWIILYLKENGSETAKAE
jgi:hypothetical protein